MDSPTDQSADDPNQVSNSGPASDDTGEAGGSPTTEQTSDPKEPTHPDTASAENDENQVESIRDALLAEDDDHTTVWERREILRPDTIIERDRIYGREEQLHKVIKELRPALRGEKINHMLLYGSSGTGKSLIINAVSEEVKDICRSQGVQFGVISVNCQHIRSLDKAVYSLIKDASDEAGVEPDISKMGTATESKYERFFEIVDKNFDAVLVILDELDLLTGQQYESANNDLLYQLSRASNRIEASLSVASLTNDPNNLMDNLDARTKSSFNPIEVVFGDYNAPQLKAILERRKDAFREGALDDAVIPLVSGLVAQGDGDARSAIDLLRNAGDHADDKGSEKVTERHIRAVEDTADVSRKTKIIAGLTTRKKLSLWAAASALAYSDHTQVPSTVVYDVYKWGANQIDSDLPKRETMNKYLKEMDTYGIINFEKRSRGRYGMRLEFDFADTDPHAYLDILSDDSRVGEIESEADVILAVKDAFENAN